MSTNPTPRRYRFVIEADIANATDDDLDNLLTDAVVQIQEPGDFVSPDCQPTDLVTRWEVIPSADLADRTVFRLDAEKYDEFVALLERAENADPDPRLAKLFRDARLAFSNDDPATVTDLLHEEATDRAKRRAEAVRALRHEA